MIRRVVEQFQNCYLSDIRASLADLQACIEPYANRLDALLSAYNSLQGSQQHDRATNLQQSIIIVDEQIACELLSEVASVWGECDRLQALYTKRGSDSARRSVRVDQAREDKERIRSLYRWLDDTYAKRAQRVVQAPRMPQRRKRYLSESEFDPDTSPDHTAKRARQLDDRSEEADGSVQLQRKSSKDIPVFVLDLCSEGDEDPDIVGPITTAGQPRFSHHNALKPNRTTDLARPQQSHERKTVQCVGDIDDNVHRRPQNINQITTKSRERSRPTPSIVPSNLASSILQAGGRHPRLAPLNHELRELLSRPHLQKYARNHTKELDNKAQIQSQMVEDATNWWKAQE
jgi:hypothetical protein